MQQSDLREAMKDAMRAKDQVRLGVIRGLLSAMTNEAVAKGKGPDGVLTEEEAEAVVRRAAKQRKDSIAQFQAGGRADLAESEQAELAVIEAMLPAQMSEAEVEAAVRAKAGELGVELSPAGKPQANQLMGALMKDLKGKADGTLVKSVVERLLA